MCNLIHIRDFLGRKAELKGMCQSLIKKPLLKIKKKASWMIQITLNSPWPSAVVARTEVEKFTGGILTGKYLANLDCLGEGPDRLTCGRKVAYPVESLVAWLRDRAN